jgi:putative ABC transport system ATP-binding protein
LIQNLSEKHAAQYRSRLIGFVFQSFNLLPFKTALENVTLPLYYQNVPPKQGEQKAMAFAKRHHAPCGLQRHRADYFGSP